jgi:hypothetical protein
MDNGMKADKFIDVDVCQIAKTGQNISGDVFISRKEDDGNRVVSVLADGLGSGVEAATLAALTSAMAMEYITSNIPVLRAAEIIMDALPLDPERHISYAMFSLVDARLDGETRIIEYGNPPFLLIRDGEWVPVKAQTLRRERWGNRQLNYWQIPTQVGDRIVLFTDGVTQSGIGSDEYPLGWGLEKTREFVLNQVRKEPEISARMLARRVLERSMNNDGRKAGDDITCSVIYFRHPRRILVLTGPPFANERDREYAQRLSTFKGKRIICGGTTANIVARELNCEVTTDLTALDPEVPCMSRMDGADLVTEGTLTLSKVAQVLETGRISHRRNGADRMVEMLLESDSIEFLIGTRINEAHQDPMLPVELDIRRNVIKKIRRLLEEKYLKETHLEFF